MFDEVNRIGDVQIGENLVKIRIDIPRVILLGRIFECLKQIAAAPGGDGIETALLVNQTGDATALGIDCYPKKLILDRPPFQADLEPPCRNAVSWPGVDQLIAHRRNIGHENLDTESV